jgi:REP element-mobilizing transposase RayT
MVLAYHCIFSMYGFWLPNDPRGSGSDYVASWELFRFGPATKVDGRISVADVPHNQEQRKKAKNSLQWPPVEVSGRQAVAISVGFRTAAKEADYAIHACSILPDHVHLVIGRHPRDIRRIVGHLKARATRAIKQYGLWHDDGRPLWGEHGWNVFLNDEKAVLRAIRYVEENPVKEGKKKQSWPFVVPFDFAASLATRRDGETTRRIGGAALRSMEAKARRERRGEMG